MSINNKTLPLVYSCSGCSSAAQMANHVALQLDRRGSAEMSCIAGIGGDVPALVRLAASGRSIIAIDGCPVACARKCLARHGVAPDVHVDLSVRGAQASARRFRSRPGCRDGGTGGTDRTRLRCAGGASGAKLTTQKTVVLRGAGSAAAVDRQP